MPIFSAALRTKRPGLIRESRRASRTRNNCAVISKLRSYARDNLGTPSTLLGARQGLLHYLRDEYESHAASFEPRSCFHERSNRLGMRMANGNGKAVTGGVACSEIKLGKNCVTSRHVIEKYLARRG